jgi:hypothetical protein
MTIRAVAIALATAGMLCACEREPVPRPSPATPAVPPAASGGQAGVDLRKHDGEVMKILRRLPDSRLLDQERAALAQGTTLRPGATAAELEAIAKRIGKPLPASYRDFLATSNGMLFHGALNVVAMRDAAAVEPLTTTNYPALGVWLAMPDVAIPLDPAAGGPLPGRALARAWVLSRVEDGDVYFIFPDLATPDGEWPVWFFGPKNPGAIAYRSFGAMLAAEQARGLQELRRR